MENAFTRHLSTPVPQSEPVDSRQVKNNAGGFTFTVSDKDRLERFLILGTDSGTYYVSEKDLTKQNITFLKECVTKQSNLTLSVIEDVSTNGRAYKNSPAIFALAAVMAWGDKDAKHHARQIFNKVIRTSTHLFEFAQYIEFLGGWGPSKRRAVADWYTSKDPDKLAYQAVKYRQRNGWTHRDLFRLVHPEGIEQHLGTFILGKPNFRSDPDPMIITGFKMAQAATNVQDLLTTLKLFPNLPWEALPTQFLKEPDVWKALFYNGQLSGQALVRNITRLSRIGAFLDMVFAGDYAARLTDEEMIRKTRLHPINFLNAVVVHQEGQIVRERYRSGNYPNSARDRKKDWATVPVIVDALNAGFHLAFKYAEPSGKRTFLAVDVSGSMSVSAAFGLDLSAAQVAGAVAMTIAKNEPYYMIRGFTNNNNRHGYYFNRLDSKLSDLEITPNMDLNQAMNNVQKQNFGGTDCSLPMMWAQENKVEVDTFIVITDNETWAGRVHPHVALREYRQKLGIDARLIVAGVSSTDFTIADPSDRGMMDVVGFDSNAPKVMADFSAGRI